MHKIVGGNGWVGLDPLLSSTAFILRGVAKIYAFPLSRGCESEGNRLKPSHHLCLGYISRGLPHCAIFNRNNGGGVDIYHHHDKAI